MGRTSTLPPPASTTAAVTGTNISVRPVFKGNRSPATSLPARKDPGRLPSAVGETIVKSQDDVRQNPRAGLPRRNSPLTRTSPRTTQAPPQEENEVEPLRPLSDNERKSKKQERNNLFKKLLSSRNEEKVTKAPVVIVLPETETEMSPLENLFNIIESNKESSEKPKPGVRVTSS